MIVDHLQKVWYLKVYIYKDLKNIKNVKRCRDGKPKSMQTR